MELAPKDVMAGDGSILMVITFHSLEEQIVMQSMAKWRRLKKGEYGTKKPITPSLLECEENSRSKSAKLYTFLFNE